MYQGDLDLYKWLKEYEHKRTNPYEKNDLWKSTKYDIEGLTWQELSDIEIPELPDQDGNPLTFGKACSSLKKTWKLYRDQKRQGLNRSDLAYRIVKIQRALGIKESEFYELDPEWADHELTLEEKQIRKEEQDEDGWNMEPDKEEDEDIDEDWENW